MQQHATQSAWECMKRQSDAYFINETQYWNLSNKLYEDHKSCPKRLECKNCTRTFCFCMLKYFRGDRDACLWCDQTINPSPANPLNRRRMEIEMPAKLMIIREETMKLEMFPTIIEEEE